MKKILKIIMLMLVIILFITMPVMADNTEMGRLKLNVINADENYELYILLPKKYIMYAIEHDNLDIDYDGANTLIYNSIPSIVVNIDNVVKETYVENSIEYVQIKLDDLGGDEYLFEIIPEYTDMDMKYRIKSNSRDNIMIIENFQMEDNKCEMEYDYAANEIKTENGAHVEFRFKITWWQILIIAILVIFLIYLNKRRKY